LLPPYTDCWMHTPDAQRRNGGSLPRCGQNPPGWSGCRQPNSPGSNAPPPGQRDAHSPGLGGCVQSRHHLAIGEIQPMESPGKCGNPFEPIQPGLLQRGVVVVVEAVEPHNPLAARQQPLTHGSSDETSGPANADRMLIPSATPGSRQWWAPSPALGERWVPSPIRRGLNQSPVGAAAGRPGAKGDPQRPAQG